MAEHGYEYLQLKLEWGDLDRLNSLSSVGFRVAHAQSLGEAAAMLLLERPLSLEGQEKAIRYYKERPLRPRQKPR